MFDVSDRKFLDFQDKTNTTNEKIKEQLNQLDTSLALQIRDINKNFDLKEIFSSSASIEEPGTQKSVRESQASMAGSVRKSSVHSMRNSMHIAGQPVSQSSFKNFIELQKFLVKEPLKRIDDTEHYLKKLIEDLDAQVVNETSNTKELMSKLEEDTKNKFDKQLADYKERDQDVRNDVMKQIMFLDKRVKKLEDKIGETDVVALNK